MSPEEFLSEVWFEWSVEGKSLPLPDAWRIRVTYIPANEEDWKFAVRKASEASRRKWNPIRPDAVFNYAVGIVWKRLAEMSPIDSSPMDPIQLVFDTEDAEQESAE